MTRRSKYLFIIFIIILIIAGAFYFITNFFRAFAPDNITISKTEIKSSNGFINPITIEKLRVDSIGEEHRPAKYTIVYLATCAIKQSEGKPPVPLKSIKLTHTGRYSWSEENVSIPMLHTELSRTRLDSSQGIIWSIGSQRFDICPIKFEPTNWYFVTFLDPQIVGIYIYIDDKGSIHKFAAYSGVSPI
ncbi:MAG TPA: hypothetical protein VK483_06470 [Chitinophagaceae bacterium]|nr:hypothetical protein [Chitinophagaceae bacterium]